MRIDTAQEWAALLERLRLSGVPYELGDVPLDWRAQLFVAMAPGIVIELVTESATAYALNLACRTFHPACRSATHENQSPTASPCASAFNRHSRAKRRAACTANHIDRRHRSFESPRSSR